MKLLERLQKNLNEACDDLWDTFVDPLEPFCDSDDGARWLPLTGELDSLGFGGVGPLSEVQLRDIRNQCRLLAATNEFAINGHENRVSYIVGSGHTYRAVVRKNSPPSQGGVGGGSRPDESLNDLARTVQAELDEFLRANNWQRRQAEIVRRRDRDGEVFLRFFTAADGTTRVRFVEPGQVATPPSRAAEPSHRLGIVTDSHDVETVAGYYIDGELVDAVDIQHRKANVDANVRRGLPLFYPVRKNLRRAEKLLRNMSVVAEIQSAIALVRRHRYGTRGALEQFAAAQADATAVTANAATGRATHFKRYAPGTILDAHADVEYDFPAAALDAAAYVAVLQAELRAIASRLVMPEFMLTADASNANYSSTMVAEGPAMRMFARLQAEQVADDLEVMWRVVRGAVAAGRLPPEATSVIEIQATPPSLAVRDQLEEAQRFAIEHERGILSPQTWSQRTGLDYEQEQANLASHRAPLFSRDAQRSAERSTRQGDTETGRQGDRPIRRPGNQEA
jgi:hypothetical protein